MLDTLLFTVLPYLALFVVIFGTIYRYRTKGFSVSSLSSEFLEGNKLFLCSKQFHCGLMFLFFGHLIAFLIPGSVLAWNSEPLRLMILEVSGFVFGLAVLVGLIALIYRRITTDRIREVTSKMDVALYLVLLLQVVTGLLIAYGERWGSSWFAAVLTPYLWSVLEFRPDITAVSAMPWTIKTHIAGGYLLILIIPFTRLMQMLDYPLHYIRRPYQVVMWYWNRKTIRNPDTSRRKVKPTNN